MGMAPARRDQFALATLLAAIALLALWFGWAEVVVDAIEQAKQREAAAAALKSEPTPAVVFPVR
jgi:hypothetical protein